MRVRRTLLATAAAALLTVVGFAATTGSADAAQSWAPASTASIHPGTPLPRGGAPCQSFVHVLVTSS